MATHRPDRLTDADLNRIEYAGQQDRYIDPKSNLIATVNKSGISFGLMLYANSKQKYHTLGKFRFGVYGIAQARKDALQLQAQADRGELDKPTAHLFANAWTKLEQRHKVDGRQPRTIAGYKANINRYSPDLWDTDVSTIRRGWCKEKHDSITAENGPNAANAWIRSISTVLSEAVEREWVEYNPAKGIRLNRTAPKVTSITDDDIAELLTAIDTVPSPIIRGAWHIGINTGLRSGDIAKMRWADVDLSDAVLHVPEPKGGPSRAFYLPLTTQAVDAFAKIPRLGGRYEEWVFPATRSATGHIFDHRHKTLPNPHYGRHLWSTAAERAGVDEWRRALLLNQRPSTSVNAIYTHSAALEYRSEAQKVSDYIEGLRVSAD